VTALHAINTHKLVMWLHYML